MVGFRFCLLVSLSYVGLALGTAAGKSSSLLDGLVGKQMTREDYEDRKAGLTPEDMEPEEMNLIPSFLRASSSSGNDDGRELAATCTEDQLATCSAAIVAGLFVGDDSEIGIYGACGALAKEKDGVFCYHPDLFETVCCGHATDDCCDINGGAVAGVIIVGLVVLVASIFACCFCCKCCCCYDRLHGIKEDNNQKSNAAPSPGMDVPVTPPKVEASAQ